MEKKKAVNAFTSQYGLLLDVIKPQSSKISGLRGRTGACTNYNDDRSQIHADCNYVNPYITNTMVNVSRAWT